MKNKLLISIVLLALSSNAFADKCDDLKNKLDAQIKKIEFVIKERNKADDDIFYLKSKITKKLQWIDENPYDSNRSYLIREYNSLVKDLDILISIKKKMNSEYENLAEEYEALVKEDIQKERYNECKKAQ